MVVIVFDSTIVEFSSYGGYEPSNVTSITIFVIISIIFVGTTALLLNFVKRIVTNYPYKTMLVGLRYFHYTIIGVQIVTISLILLIILQMLIFSQYSLVLLRIQTYISHLSALLFLSFMVLTFCRWLSSKRNNTILLYTISFSLMCLTIIVSLMYLDAYFLGSPLPDVSPFPIVSYVTNLVPNASFTESLSNIFDALSLTSFLLMWIATVILLKQYRHRLGHLKYFFLMGMPLIYYIYPFQSYFGDVLFPLLQSFSVSFSIAYVLIFSATKQVGAVLFSLVFWTTSSLVYDDRISKSLLISSIGIAILFGSVEITPLQYHVYPPYGLITESFIPLGSYLLLVGISISAKNISQDAELRKEFYRRAESQLNLLKAIGVSEMEKELMKQVASLQKRSSITEIPDETLEDEKVKVIIREVLDELYYSKVKKQIQKS